MQIKTLTFHNAINYGAVLQAYALPAKIKELGYEDVYLYDYRNTKIDNSYKVAFGITKLALVAISSFV